MAKVERGSHIIAYNRLGRMLRIRENTKTMITEWKKMIGSAAQHKTRPHLTTRIRFMELMLDDFARREIQMKARAVAKFETMFIVRIRLSESPRNFISGV